LFSGRRNVNKLGWVENPHRRTAHPPNVVRCVYIIRSVSVSIVLGKATRGYSWIWPYSLVQPVLFTRNMTAHATPYYSSITEYIQDGTNINYLIIVFITIYDFRKYAFTARTINTWNSLPNTCTVTTFRTQLKTLLFV